MSMRDLINKINENAEISSKDILTESYWDEPFDLSFYLNSNSSRFRLNIKEIEVEFDTDDLRDQLFNLRRELTKQGREAEAEETFRAFYDGDFGTEGGSIKKEMETKINKITEAYYQMIRGLVNEAAIRKQEELKNIVKTVIAKVNK